MKASARTALTFAVAAALFCPHLLVAQAPPKLWIDSLPSDTISCRGLMIQLVGYDRDDLWLGHVFQLRVSNRADSTVRFDPTMFAALLRDGTQQTFPSSEELTERALAGYKAKQELKASTKQESKRGELRSRRDLQAEGLLPTASSVKRIALGPLTTPGIAFGGRDAELMREYRAADLPLTLFCDGKRMGVVSGPVRK